MYVSPTFEFFTEFTEKMDGDLSEGGMQTVALGDGAASGETNYQPAAGGPALAPSPSSGMPPVQSAAAPSTQPISTPQARPTSLPQYPHNPGSAYASPNSANSPGKLCSVLPRVFFSAMSFVKFQVYWCQQMKADKSRVHSVGWQSFEGLLQLFYDS